MTATEVTTGCRVTRPTHRLAGPLRSVRALRAAAFPARAASATASASAPCSAVIVRRRRADVRFRAKPQPTTRPFANPRKAGVSVSPMHTAMATATDAATPMVVRNGMPAKPRPIRAMSTVMPANTTAEPAVPVARAADSSGSMPPRT